MKLIIIKCNKGKGSQIIGHVKFAEQVIPKLKAAGYCCANSQNELSNYIAGIFNNKPNHLPGLKLKCNSGNPLLYLLDEIDGCASVTEYQDTINIKWKKYNAWYEGIKREREVKAKERYEIRFQETMSELMLKQKGWYLVELRCSVFDFQKGGFYVRWTNWKVIANSAMDAYNKAVANAENTLNAVWFEEAIDCQIDFHGLI